MKRFKKGVDQYPRSVRAKLSRMTSADRAAWVISFHLDRQRKAIVDALFAPSPLWRRLRNR